MFLIGIFLVVLVALGVGIQAKHYVEDLRLYNELRQGVNDLVQPGAKGEPSPLAQTVNSIGEVIGKSTAQALTSSVNASMGGTMKGVNAELKEQAVKANPKLGLMEFLPKSMKKNNMASLGLMYLLENMGKGGNGNPGALSIPGAGSPGSPPGSPPGSDGYQGRKHRD